MHRRLGGLLARALHTAAPALRPALPRAHPRTLEFVERTGTAPLPDPLTLSIIPDFLTQDEHDMLVLETTKKLRRLFGRQGYLEGHLDTVIKGYKEATISGWMTAATAQNEDEARVVAVLERVKDAMDEWLGRDRAVKWGPPHLLDLRNGNSGIGAHVDFVQESGAVIGGVCLLSPSVIVFRHKDRPDTDHFKLLAPPRALYMQADNIRYDYSHEIPMTDDPNHSFRGEFVERERRISIMMRDKLVLKPGQLPMFAARQSSQ